MGYWRRRTRYRDPLLLLIGACVLAGLIIIVLMVIEPAFG